MRRLLLLSLAGLAIAAPMMASADDYGGGWAPSLGTLYEINTAAGTHIALKNILENELQKGPASTGKASRAPRTADTSFVRLAAVQRESEAAILAALAKRQPEAVPEYRRLFATVDLAKAFEDITRPYGLRANDTADTLAGYWVMAWIAANKADLPSPPAVAAARDQVKRGLARAGLAQMDARHRQRLADEAIFNMLVLNQAYRFMSSQGHLDSVADATRKNFLALGTDLRGLSLGPGGFARH